MCVLRQTDVKASICSFGFPIIANQPTDVIYFGQEVLPCSAQFTSNISSPVICPAIKPKKRRLVITIPLAVTGSFLVILVVFSLFMWRKRRAAFSNPEKSSTPAHDPENADSQIQPDSTVELVPLRHVVDLTDQITNKEAHALAHGGHSDVYRALWRRNSAAHHPTGDETDAQQAPPVKVAVKVLRLLSDDKDDVRKKNQVSTAFVVLTLPTCQSSTLAPSP